MSQLKPTEPFKIVELAGYRYKVRTKYNYMFFLYYKQRLVKNIKDAILAQITLPEGETASSDAISLELVGIWYETHTSDDPMYMESFMESVCEPLSGSPPVKSILLDIEEEKFDEIAGFFKKWWSGVNPTQQEPKKSTEHLTSPGTAKKSGSNNRTPRKNTSRSNTAAT